MVAVDSADTGTPPAVTGGVQPTTPTSKEGGAMSVPIFESSPDNFDAEDAYREAEVKAAHEAYYRDAMEAQYAALNEIVHVCQHCGWAVTREALEANGGVPYCCRSAERNYAE